MPGRDRLAYSARTKALVSPPSSSSGKLSSSSAPVSKNPWSDPSLEETPLLESPHRPESDELPLELLWPLPLLEPIDPLPLVVSEDLTPLEPLPFDVESEHPMDPEEPDSGEPGFGPLRFPFTRPFAGFLVPLKSPMGTVALTGTLAFLEPVWALELVAATKAAAAAAEVPDSPAAAAAAVSIDWFSSCSSAFSEGSWSGFIVPLKETWSCCFRALASFMKYFCACVRTCVAERVPTIDAIAFTSLWPYDLMASRKRWCSSSVQYLDWDFWASCFCSFICSYTSTNSFKRFT
mmetsp:Transcript_27691/g.43230  ORF Transcript_27691/g.43230 Transcript_27691/m.43230 type:complete len:292 (+) Transcript_27691:184-1059(+)